MLSLRFESNYIFWLTMKKVRKNNKNKKTLKNAKLKEARLSAIIEKSVDKVVTEHRAALEKLGNE